MLTIGVPKLYATSNLNFTRDVVPLTITICCLFDRKLCIHTPPLPLIPIFLSLFNNMPWSTSSKALSKSM